ncbi:MAG: type II toxin-antitoxin system HicB family antitoxin [Moraxellaceae bacterium]|nr:type II toxin-antitoxin system HicB family antitoxin [Moraxellaceae bacterium]
MLYPAYIHRDEGSAYGVTFPDFPGCFSAADELGDLPRLAQEAVEVFFEGEELNIPAPSSPEQWENDERFEGGYWMLLDIDLSKISTRAIRLNISLPEYLVSKIDKAAEASHLNRSAFLAKSAEMMFGLKEINQAMINQLKGEIDFWQAKALEGAKEHNEEKVREALSKQDEAVRVVLKMVNVVDAAA